MTIRMRLLDARDRCVKRSDVTVAVVPEVVLWGRRVFHRVLSDKIWIVVYRESESYVLE